MKKVNKKRKFFGILFVAIIVLIFYTKGTGTYKVVTNGAAIYDSNFTASKEGSYASYYEAHKDSGFNGSQVDVPILNFNEGDGVEIIENYEGKAAVYCEEESSLTWKIDVKNSGLYALKFNYYPVEGYGASIERRIFIDGEIPFNEAENVEFSRIYVDDERNPSGKLARPKQVEERRWMTEYATDSLGYYGMATYFYLEEGEHTLTIESVREPVAIAGITFISEDTMPKTYKEVIQEAENNGVSKVSGVFEDGLQIIQAENTIEKNDPTLYAKSDSTSTKNQPYSNSQNLLNTIGGDSWSSSNQWIKWTVNAPKSGYYHIGLRVKQNFVRDIYTNRALYIDGMLPFQEAQNIHFYYDEDWQVIKIGEEEPYLFYLEAGEHEIMLSTGIGDMAGVLLKADYILENLSKINLELLALLSTSPDTDRDYQIGKYMPEIVVALKENAGYLKEVYDEMVERTGKTDSLTSELEQLISLLGKMHNKPDKIASLYSRYRDLVGTLGEWMTNVRKQPLLLDYLFLAEPDAEITVRENTFVDKISSNFLSFLYSFKHDSTSISNSNVTDETKDEIVVWIGSGLTGGRDQAMALNQMIQDDFTVKTGIPVKLQLVPEETILSATLAGRGPDVALQVKMTTPVDFAIRKAAYDLTNFKDFNEVESNFFDGAKDAFVYDGGIYALPETMTFPMLFYRTDIMKDLGIDVNQLNTWNDITSILPLLQAKNMNFGLPATMPTYSMFLYQLGGEYYTTDSTASALDAKVSLDAFEMWTDFYSSYSLPVDYNMENRFRTGEMPIAIAEYTQYNLLSISAPEIKGKWAMKELVGYVGKDGTVNNVSPTTVQGCMLMNACENKADAWEFIKWWTSADSQYEFGKQLEAVMGAAARYNTANIDALKRLPWTASDRQSLMDQTENLKGIPQVPGGYLTERNLNFAKLAVINKKENPRESLTDYSENITEEITIKRKEFGLDYRE